MFSKSSKYIPSETKGDTRLKSDHPPSIIAADMRINGDLICSGAIHVDGRIEGDIQSHEVVIGESATIHGNIQGDNIRICGSVEGQIKGDFICLTKTARVRGDVLHKSLAIEQGAFIEGMCKRLDGKSHIVSPEIKAHLALDTQERALALG